MPPRVNYSGLVVAGIGFFLTRFTVTLAAGESPLAFYFGGVVPLVLGLGLAAFGVALAVSDVEASFVRTTAAWCVAGTAGMLVLVLLTLLGAAADPGAMLPRTYLANFLVGGSVGGTLTGLYAARNRRHRANVHQQANRLEVLNRILRHEVLNAVTVIKGYVELEAELDRDARRVIEDRSAAIERTIEEVKYLTRGAGSGGTIGSVDLVDRLEASVRTVRERHPEATIDLELPRERPTVRADERVEQVFVHLVDNAVLHASGAASPVVVSASVSERSVRVEVRDAGPGLPESQRRLLETGDIEAFDDPTTGFGLNVVRLLVERYRGTIETDVGPDGTTISVTLPRHGSSATGVRPLPDRLTGVRPAIPHLTVTFLAALAAGVVYGLVSWSFGGSIGVIGVFYGLRNPVVGWITHEFHSVVFGFVFAGLVSLAPARYRDRLLTHLAIGIGWGLVLAILAAGVVAPVWLRLLGIPADVPSLSTQVLASHLAWGASLGVMTALGYEHVAPRLGRTFRRLRLRGPGG